jgi:hypothetical protein
VGLELDPVRAERLERVPELEQLRLAVRARALELRRDPRPADLEPAMLRDDREIARAPDRPAGRAVDRRERSLDPGVGVRQGGLEPASQAGLVLLAHDRPAPQRGIERDPPQVVEVIGAERLEPHARALQDHRFDPGLRGHRRMVFGSRPLRDRSRP